MPSVYLRKNKLWIKVKQDGVWIARKTPYRPGEEEKARRYAVAAQRAIDARLKAPDDGPMTVARYAEIWSTERETRVRSAKGELVRLRKYMVPKLGHLMLDELRPEHVRDLVRELRQKDLPTGPSATSTDRSIRCSRTHSPRGEWL